MTRIKDITYEDGSLTHATSGHDTTVGTPTLDSGSNLRDTYSMLTNVNGDLGRETFTAIDTVYVSEYFKFSTLPATGASRILFVKNATTVLARIYVTSAGALQLRNGGGTQIGSNSSITVVAGSVYRVGVRYTKGTGANAITEGYHAADDNAFGAAFASSSAGTETAQADTVDGGQQSGGTTAACYIDSWRIDDAAMPGPDGAAAAAARAFMRPTGIVY